MKIQRISQFQGQFPFTNFLSSYEDYRKSFLDSDLGRIYESVPWEKLVKEFNLQDAKKGPLSTFSPHGKIALMFLKHYACVSDHKLNNSMEIFTINFFVIFIYHLGNR